MSSRLCVPISACQHHTQGFDVGCQQVNVELPSNLPPDTVGGPPQEEQAPSLGWIVSLLTAAVWFVVGVLAGHS